MHRMAEDMGDLMSLPAYTRPHRSVTPRFHKKNSTRSLFSVDEKSETSDSDFTSNTAHSGILSRAISLPAAAVTSVRKKRSEKSSRSKKPPERLALVRILASDATKYAETGEETKALESYRQATKIAGTELCRIHQKISRSHRLTEAARISVQDRLSEDLCMIGISIGQFRAKMAILYDRLGNWDEALLCCRDALEIYKHQPTIKNPSTKVPSAAPQVEAMEAMIARLETVTRTLIGRAAQMQQMDELRDELLHTIDTKERNDVYCEIQVLAEAMLTAEIDALGASHPQIADSLQLLSTVALERGNFRQAVDYLLKCTEIGLECLGQKHPRIGQYHLRLARIQITQELHDEALTSFQKAIEVLFHSPRYSRTLGAVYNDVATIYLCQKNNTDLALENLQCAVKQFEKATMLDGLSQDSGAPDSIQIYRSMGHCYMKKLDFGRARVSFSQVLELQQKSRKVYDNVKDLGLGMVGVEDSLVSFVEDENVAESHVDLGRALAAEKAHDRALVCFEDALEILNNLEFQSERMNNRNNLATRTLYCIGEEACASGKLDRALQAYNESVRLMGLLTGSEETSSSLVHRLLCFLGMGRVHTLRSDFTAALRIYSRTLKQSKSPLLPQNHPIIKMTKEKLSEVKSKIDSTSHASKNQLAQLELAIDENVRCEKFDDALSNLKRALSIRRENIVKLKALKGDLSTEVSGVANLLETFGFVYAKQGDIENSGRAFSEAFKLRSHYN